MTSEPPSTRRRDTLGEVAVSQKISDRARRKLVVASALGLTVVGVIVAVVGVFPLYRSLQKKEQDNLSFALRTRSMAVTEFAGRVVDVAFQVTSRTKARKLLEKYNRGESTLQDRLEDD